MITAPSTLPVRPTTDFAKSALFNILNNQINFAEVNVLDLFAGIGGISLEFISRGAKSVTAIDSNVKCCAFIKETVVKLEIKNLTVLKAEVFNYLKSCTSRFDIIFADAPFDMATTDAIADLVFDNNLLKENGILIIEHQSKRKLQSKIEPTEIRKYGNCAFTFYSRKNDG